MAVVLRPGWELENPSNSSNIFRARVPQTLNGVPGGGTKYVEIVNNISTGNFDYYTVNPIGLRSSQPFLSYNATNDIPTIRDLTTYGEFYDTQKGQTQYTTILKSSKEATLDLAQKNAGIDPVSVRNYNNIKAKPGYKSLANTATKPGAGATPGAGGNPQKTSAAAANADPPAFTDKDIAESKPLEGGKDSASVKALEIVRNSNGGKYLKYPIRDTYAEDDDMLKIEIHNYVESGLGNDDIKKFSLKSLTERLRGSVPIKIIYLPAYNQNGISDSLTVGWGEGTLNPLTAMFAKTAMGAVNAGSSTDPAQAMINEGKKLLDNLGSLAASSELKSLIVNYFTEQAVQTTGLLSRTAGAAINNNVELLFTGVQLRDFTLTYRLTPRFNEEATRIKDIIRAFKISMTPSLSANGLFLLAPCVYQLSYITSKEKGPHPYLNKFKACALKGFNVNYTPDGNYMTYADGTSMTQYEIQFSFGEIDPVYRDDYEKLEGTMGY